MFKLYYKFILFYLQTHSPKEMHKRQRNVINNKSVYFSNGLNRLIIILVILKTQKIGSNLHKKSIFQLLYGV